MATPKWKALLEKRKAEKDANDVKMEKLGMGKTVLRILPHPKDADEVFYQDFGQHWIKHKSEKAANGKPKIISAPLCHNKTYDQPCEYCDAISEALGHMADNPHAFTDDEKKMLEEARASHRILVNAAIRNGSGGYEVKPVELAKSAFNALIDLISEYGEDLVTPTGGIDVVFTRTGAGLNTQYTVMPARDHGSDIASGWESQCVDLKAFAESKEINAANRTASIAGIGMYAGIKPATAAIGHSGGSRAALTSAPAAKYGSSESIVDDGLEDALDDLADMGGEIQDAEIVDDVPFETETKKAAPAADMSQDDMDLLDELDDL